MHACYGTVPYFRNDKKVKNHDSGALRVEELEDAEIYWGKYIQGENYPEEIKALKINKPIPNSSKICKQSPFLSENELRMIKGRLQNANLISALKHPITLPSNHLLLKRIIYDSHEELFHSRVSATPTQIKEKYWTIKCRQSIKYTLRRCIICKRLKYFPGKQSIAPLPATRTVIILSSYGY
ncbi:uncharacterized protein NPIL_234511 [Nephila pilipes]|uniref:Integrase zinc-binding domain-containing protein n=1 Tax=Nephila pilipes TaxID=299642 RepID=A0A8X6TI89_NEPPI|nr:uncharacterized protein NPIL_234511 [Nephila pilipes]